VSSLPKREFCGPLDAPPSSPEELPE